MKKKQIFATGMLILSVAVLSITGCRKDRDTDNDDTLGYDTGIFESVSNEVDNMVGTVTQDGTVNQKLSTGNNPFNFSGCAIVTHDSVNHHITIDFGSGCTGLDGRNRAGKINIDYSGQYYVQGSYHVVTFDSFYVDSRHIEGTRTITNMGYNSSNYMNWNIVASNMKMTRTDGFWRTWNSTRNRELISGGNDLIWSNDVYRINGNATGSNSNGRSFTMIISGLLRDFSCYWITEGTISITPSNGLTRTIDFGNGSCDNQATLTVGNQTRTITLR
jgi:hypothetical protein